MSTLMQSLRGQNGESRDLGQIWCVKITHACENPRTSDCRHNVQVIICTMTPVAYNSYDSLRLFIFFAGQHGKEKLPGWRVIAPIKESAFLLITACGRSRTHQRNIGPQKIQSKVLLQNLFAYNITFHVCCFWSSLLSYELCNECCLFFIWRPQFLEIIVDMA